MSPVQIALPLLLLGCSACTARPAGGDVPAPQAAADAAATQTTEPVLRAPIDAVVTPSPEGTTVLEVGQVLEIVLQGNASTGYAWAFEHEGVPQLERVPALSRPVQPPEPKERPMVGSPSMQRWHFKAVQPGEASIRMVYRRPWMKESPPEREAEFKVVVREAAR